MEYHLEFYIRCTFIVPPSYDVLISTSQSGENDIPSSDVLGLFFLILVLILTFQLLFIRANTLVHLIFSLFFSFSHLPYSNATFISFVYSISSQVGARRPFYPKTKRRHGGENSGSRVERDMGPCFFFSGEASSWLSVGCTR